MSLQDIKDELQSRISGGDLDFGAVGAQVASLWLVTAELPPISDFPIAGARVDLSGDGPSQTLTIAGTVDWGLLQGTTVTIVVSVDPTDAASYVVAVRLAAPSSATLSIPGVPWFKLGSFQIRGQSQPTVYGLAELAPQALLSVGTTLLISGDSSQTPIPIAIGTDPTGALMVSLDTSAVTLPGINDVLAAFGNQASAIRLPATINDLIGFSLQELLVCFDPAAGTVTQIGVQIGREAADQQAGWPIIPGFFTLDGYTLGLNVTDPLGTIQVGGLVSATGKLGSVDIGVSALHPASGGWNFSGYIGKEDGVRVDELVGGLARQFGVTLPEVLTSFTLNDFEFGFDTQTYDASGHFALDFHVNGTPVSLTASAVLTHDKTKASYTKVVDGKLMVGSATFEVAFGQSPSTFTASWNDMASPLGFADIAACFGFNDVPPVPASLDLQLVEATISYNFSGGTLVLTARSKNPYYGNAAFVARGGQYFFGVRVDTTIDLTNLPLVSSVLSPDQTVGISGIQAVIASADLDAGAAAAINGLLTGSGLPQVPGAGLAAGVALFMTFQAGSYQQPLTLAAGSGSGREEGGGAQPAVAAAAAGSSGAVASSTTPDGTVWYSLQKQFGPVTFQKVGIRYQSSADGKDGVLYVLMNAGLEAGPLAIAVLGLGVGSPLTTFQPKFTIDGLAITYAEGPVELSGALVGTIEPVSFSGELILGVEQLQIAALGGYTEVDGHPSFFLYAVLDYPIGGPAFFFVTGLAAGFGYNRRLVIPPVDQVSTFPLVQWAQGMGNPPPMTTNSIAGAVKQVVGELSSSGVIAPSVGDHWLAVGVHFTSFELVDSFALLTSEFGNQFEIDLLGVSTVQLPPAPAPPVALAQMELKAAFIPAEGLLSVSGQLTPESFVLSPDCHLTGGFALTTWFSGDHEGEFVLTLGGYSPRFDLPSYYPVVPRLGLSWQVTPELAITGDQYFALTSSAVMAGGGLSAVWQSGDIRAWFDVEADFLLVFEPFHYYISVGIQLGASFTVNLLFTSFTVSIHLGVTLEIWGPDFTGRATVDLSIISFTIGFGRGAQDSRKTISWGEFLAKLMPGVSAPGAQRAGPGPLAGRGQALQALAVAGQSLPGAASASASVEDTVPAIVQIVVQGGLVKRLSDTDGELNWVINGEQLQLVTQSAIPTKDWTFSRNVQLADGAPAANTNFGVGPVGADLTSTHVIKITTNEPTRFRADPVVRNVPAALWQTRTFDANGVPVGLDPLNSTTVAGVFTGFIITPLTTHGHTLSIRIEDLDYTIISPSKTFTWTDAAGPASDPFDGQTVWGTIAAAGPAAVRAQLVTAIAAQGWPVPDQVDVTELSTQAGYDPLASPVLRLLGEQR